MTNIVRPKFATRNNTGDLVRIASTLSKKAYETDRHENNIYVGLHTLYRAGDREKLRRSMELALDLVAKLDIADSAAGK